MTFIQLMQFFFEVSERHPTHLCFVERRARFLWDAALIAANPAVCPDYRHPAGLTPLLPPPWDGKAERIGCASGGLCANR